MILSDDALRELANSLPENGELPYPIRRQLRLALKDLGHNHVVRLGELCAHRVIPVWSAAYPTDNMPIEVMAAALAGRASEDQLGALRTHLDNVYHPEPPFGAAFAAGMACWALANEAAAETFEPEANHERELDPDYWPPCFFASAAEAGGATWEDNADTNRRTEFWRWYLLNAVPTARDTN